MSGSEIRPSTVAQSQPVSAPAEAPTPPPPPPLKEPTVDAGATAVVTNVATQTTMPPPPTTATADLNKIVPKDADPVVAIRILTKPQYRHRLRDAAFARAAYVRIVRGHERELVKNTDSATLKAAMPVLVHAPKPQRRELGDEMAKKQDIAPLAELAVKTQDNAMVADVAIGGGVLPVDLEEKLAEAKATPEQLLEVKVVIIQQAESPKALAVLAGAGAGKYEGITQREMTDAMLGKDVAAVDAFIEAHPTEGRALLEAQVEVATKQAARADRSDPVVNERLDKAQRRLARYSARLDKLKAKTSKSESDETPFDPAAASRDADLMRANKKAEAEGAARGTAQALRDFDSAHDDVARQRAQEQTLAQNTKFSA